jgi:uncharacterized protein YqgC (DUF456 family)
MKIIKVNPWRMISGIVLIIVGLAGIVLPVLPGWILIFIGLELVGLQLVFFDKIIAYAKSKIKNADAKGTK